jgi:hypothetical protein
VWIPVVTSDFSDIIGWPLIIDYHVVGVGGLQVTYASIL